MKNKTLIYCINKNVNKHGVTKSFILKDNFGNVIEASRQQVLEMFRNPNMKFVNLKLSSDGKILYSSPEDSINRGFDSKKKDNKKAVDASMLHSLVLIGYENDKEYFDSLINNLNSDLGNPREQNNTYKSYLKDFATDMDTDEEYALQMLNRLRTESNTIQIVGIYYNKNKKLHIMGYKILNIGDKPITYIEGKYCFKHMNLYMKSYVEKQLMPKQTVIINRVDAIKLIIREEYSGKFDNCRLAHGYLPKYKIVTAEDILNSYYLDCGVTSNVTKLDGDNINELIFTDETTDEITHDKARQALKDAKGLKGVMDAFKR